MYAIYPNNFYLLTFYSLVYRIQYVFIPMTYRIRNIFYKDSIVSVFWDWLLALKDKKIPFFISISFSTVAFGAKSIKLFYSRKISMVIGNSILFFLIRLIQMLQGLHQNWDLFYYRFWIRSFLENNGL